MSCKKLKDRTNEKRTFVSPYRLDGSLVTQSILATLHEKSQFVVDILMSLLFENDFNHSPDSVI